MPYQASHAGILHWVPKGAKLHSVFKSASDDRRWRTSRAISRCARRLAIEHGFDGFTMDDLAECADVSRRTLFNYVPGKLDAVLGVEEAPDPELVALFLSGGPTGHLLTDVKELVCVLLEAEAADPQEVNEMRRLLRSDSRLYSAVHERFADVMRRFSEGIALREGGAVDPLTVRLIATVAMGLFDIALDESLEDSGHTLAEHYGRVFDASAALFDHPAAQPNI